MTRSRTPLISVIVPVFNVGLYLQRCVDSIVSQTHCNLEIILVDDGSDDNSPQICDEWAKNDSRIKVVHKINGGLSEARNAGIEIATGEYLSFVDGDDVVHKDFISELLMTIKASGKKMSACLFQFFSDNNPLYFKSIEGSVKVLNLEESIRLYCSLTPQKSTPLISCCTKLYHRSLFQEIRFPVKRIYEDACVSYRLLDSANGVAFVDAPLYGYYMRGDSIMGQKEQHSLEDVLSPYEEAIRFFSDKKKGTEAHLFYPPLVMREIYRYWVASVLKKDKKETKEVLTLIREDCRKMRLCKEVSFSNKMIFSVIAFFPFLYSIYRKIAPGFVGGR